MSQFSSSVATQSFKSKRVEKKSGCARFCEGLELFMYLLLSVPGPLNRNSNRSICGDPGMSQFSSSVATQSFKSKRLERKSEWARCCEGLELFMFCCQYQGRSIQIVFNRVVEILG